LHFVGRHSQLYYDAWTHVCQYDILYVYIQGGSNMTGTVYTCKQV